MQDNALILIPFLKTESCSTGNYTEALTISLLFCFFFIPHSLSTPESCDSSISLIFSYLCHPTISVPLFPSFILSLLIGLQPVSQHGGISALQGLGIIFIPYPDMIKKSFSILLHKKKPKSSQTVSIKNLLIKTDARISTIKVSIRHLVSLYASLDC